MKKSVIKVLTVSAMFIGLGASAVFAKTPNNSRSNPYGHPMGAVSERSFVYCAPGNGTNGHGGSGISNADIVGTVSGINVEKSIITVKDIDGKETQVHVNPFTKIRSIPDSDKNARQMRKANGDNQYELSDLKGGDYVAVKKISSETKTLEAARIIVAIKSDK